MGATGSHLEHISSEALTACMSTDAGQRASSSLLRASFLTCKMEMKSDLPTCRGVLEDPVAIGETLLCKCKLNYSA